MKQIIVVRHDINMSAGKLAVQVAHASLKAYISSPKMICEDWVDNGMKKVVVSIDSVAELMELQKELNDNQITYASIVDAGKTEFNNIPTLTCIGIGPEKSEYLNKFTRHLRLLK